MYLYVYGGKGGGRGGRVYVSMFLFCMYVCGMCKTVWGRGDESKKDKTGWKKRNIQ
jgi:hypothetical protein